MDDAREMVAAMKNDVALKNIVDDSRITVVDGLLAVDGRPVYDALYVDGNIDLAGNLEIIRLPDALAIMGHINLNGCSNLKAMPKHLMVSGCVDLRGTAADKLPDVLIADGDVDMRDTLYSVLPGRMSSGRLKADGCTKLKEVDGQHFAELSAKSCVALHRIANACIDFIVISDAPIIELGPNLVSKQLEIRDCDNLMSIPDDMGLPHHLIIRNCGRLRPLPASIWPMMLVINGLHFGQSGVLCPWITKQEEAMMIGRELREVMPHYLLRDHPVMRRQVKAIVRHEFNGENMQIVGRSSIRLVDAHDMARNEMEDRCAPHTIPQFLLDEAGASNLPAIAGPTPTVRKPKVLGHERRFQAKSRKRLAKFK